MHLKIKKINDPFIPLEKLNLNLNKLRSLIDNNKPRDVKKLLNRLLKSFKSNSKIIDHTYLEKNN